MTEEPGRSRATRGILFGLLLLALATVGLAIALLVQAATGSGVSAVTVAPAPTVIATTEQLSATPATAATAGAVMQVTPTIALATPWGVVGLEPGTQPPPETATAVPDQPPVVLLGPPAGSQFREGDAVTFYWDWSESLRDEWQFAVIIGNADGSTVMGTAEAGNLGTLQQLGVTLDDVVDDAGDYQWSVVVEETSSGTVIARSEQRPIVVLANGGR